MAEWAPRVLVVDEERFFREAIGDVLAEAGIACEVAGRNMTRAEWEEFGPRTIEYRPTCDQYSVGT